MDAGQYAAAVAAVKEKGVLSGKRVERRESGSPGEFAELENMTADELVQFIQEGIAPTAGKKEHEVVENSLIEFMGGDPKRLRSSCAA